MNVIESKVKEKIIYPTQDLTREVSSNVRERYVIVVF